MTRITGFPLVTESRLTSAVSCCHVLHLYLKWIYECMYEVSSLSSFMLLSFSFFSISCRRIGSRKSLLIISSIASLHIYFLPFACSEKYPVVLNQFPMSICPLVAVATSVHNAFHTLFHLMATAEKHWIQASIVLVSSSSLQSCLPQVAAFHNWLKGDFPKSLRFTKFRFT